MSFDMTSSLTPAAFLIAAALALVLVPLARRAALRWGVLDAPSTPIKTHRVPTPYLGGVAVYAAVAGTLVLLRLLTHFPTGTLRSLRAVLVGGGFVMLLGLVDDVKRGGLDFRWKFFFQFLGAALLMAFDIRIKFIQPDWLGAAFTVLWVVGVTNAFNIIDIMDGLSSSQAMAACVGFLFIALPHEEIYVNLAAAALAGACLGFLPYNLSSSRKIFLGDAGSLFLGFTLAAVSMGMSYTTETPVGLVAPFLILGLPIYDTLFVMALRVRQGKSPFLGSKDHLALKLRALGFTSRQVVAILAVAAAAFSISGYVATRAPSSLTAAILSALAAVGLLVMVRMDKVQVP
jgi:UDP-GlcNAc:undecaprenyl-phosphate/decaprenyl-phosphate GlcNAc-1-phosphate transferase